MTQVVAHRGASRAERENTIAAFAAAAAVGADAVELDVRRTRDGALVVHHNPHLEDGRVIQALTAGELPAHIPTLGAALDACAGMWVNVEIKNDPSEPDFDPTDSIADDTVDVLRHRNEHGRWLISSFRLETVNRCRQIAPFRTAWLTVDVPSDAGSMLRDLGHAALHPWVGAVRHDHIRECHLHGVQVTTWTCDDETRMAELISWGIDGLCTNVPHVALSVRQARPSQA
jgi:glycerophosphoryl diester phosphodiesterase